MCHLQTSDFWTVPVPSWARKIGHLQTSHGPVAVVGIKDG
jgi:hypothetical protein